MHSEKADDAKKVKKVAPKPKKRISIFSMKKMKKAKVKHNTVME